MSAINSYTNINELIKDYYDQSLGTYLNQSITVGTSTLTCDIYRVASNTSLTSSIFTGCIDVDANTQIIIGSNLKVEDGVTLIPPYRCKGIIIGCPGTFTNAGHISMTARGASAVGVDIPLVDNYKIDAVGGAGASGISSAGNGSNGNSPASGIISCGGGGSGAHTGLGSSGNGGSGTSFSGGAGGGGNGNNSSDIPAGSSSGGAGGAALTVSGYYLVRGGAGNPVGTDAIGYTNPSSFEQYLDNNGIGTGGLIIIFANNINITGSIESKGSQGPGIVGHSGGYCDFGGGASGGGCIAILGNVISTTGTISTAGGSASNIDSTASVRYTGGTGGDGSFVSLTIQDLVLMNPKPLSLALTEKQYLDDIPVQDGRLLGLISDNELMYEYNGTRHRAVDDTGALDLSRIIPPGQRTPDQFEVAIINPQEGQVMKYNATNEQWENGEIDTKHTYSTDECVVGTWIDGKPIYEKTIDCEYASSSSPMEITKAHGILNIGALVDVSGKGQSVGGGGFPIPFCYKVGSTELFIAIQISDTNVVINANYDISRFRVYVTLQYTKTTDTV